MTPDEPDTIHHDPDADPGETRLTLEDHPTGVRVRRDRYGLINTHPHEYAWYHAQTYTFYEHELPSLYDQLGERLGRGDSDDD